MNSILVKNFPRTIYAYFKVYPCARSYSTIKGNKPPNTQTSKIKHENKKNLNNRDNSKPRFRKDFQRDLNNSQNKEAKAEDTSGKQAENNNEKSTLTLKKREYVKGSPFSRRSSSTTKWITRQLKDPYVKQAHEDGMVSRAAYKLKEMNNELKIIKPGYSVLDLGAAPGGWTQVATFIVRENGANGRVVSVDINDMQGIEGSTFLKLDFTKDESIKAILQTLKGRKVEVVLSDMAPSYSGQSDVDHARLMALSSRAFDISKFILNDGGSLLVKISRGGTEKEFIESLKKCFRQVKMVKPPASRQESSEIYASAKGFNSKAILDDPKVQKLKKEWNISQK